jgi:hypothetical protein
MMKTKDILAIFEAREIAEHVMRIQYESDRSWYCDCACADCDTIYKYHQLTWFQKW